MTSIQFRLATAADADAIAALHTLSWQTTLQDIYPEKFLQRQVPLLHRQRWQELQNTFNDGSHYLCLAENTLADGEKALVGFIFCQQDKGEWGTLLDNLHVHPDMQGRGLGYQLTQNGARWSREVLGCNAMHLWCAEENRSAINAYLRWGGERVERSLTHHNEGPNIWAYRIYWEEIGQSLLHASEV